MTTKARLVVYGSLVDPRGLSTWATVVKLISVILLDVIANSQHIKILKEDIENAFIQDHTKEQIYTRYGPKFGDREHSITLIVRSVYGLTIYAERFRTILADFLRTLGYVPSCYCIDV